MSQHEIDEVLFNNKKELKSLKGKVSLVAGGPPCQGFSLAGKRNENDERNDLVKKYISFIEIVEPKIIFFENVKGFNIGFKNANGERGIAYSNIVINELKRIGYYDADYRIINFSEYGIPQKEKELL